MLNADIIKLDKNKNPDMVIFGTFAKWPYGAKGGETYDSYTRKIKS